MKGESSRCEAQWRRADALRGIPQDAPEAQAGTLTGGHDTTHGSGRYGGEKWGLVVEWIDLAVVEKAPMLFMH